MKRFHGHVNVDQLDSSIRFYTTLFGAAPTLLKPDYAKWMLDDPRVDFAISQRGCLTGVDHPGMQAEDAADLAAIGTPLQAADAVVLAEKGTTCCYARPDRFWAEDPQGVHWESFHTHGEAANYTSAPNESGATCCGLATDGKPAASCGPNANCC